MDSDSAIYVGRSRGTYRAQLGSQQFVFVGEIFVLQQELAVHLSAFGYASLERGGVSLIGEDSRRVILTQPSLNYSTGISGTGDRWYLH